MDTAALKITATLHERQWCIRVFKLFILFVFPIYAFSQGASHDNFKEKYGLKDTLKGILKEIHVVSERNNGFNIGHLRQVEGTAIYAGKKSEVVMLEGLPANLATNNTRQVFAKVAGINVIENDGAGLQMGVGGRGLNPNRVSNFNTRQNGYDISADPLGYPESYYTPPTEALERVEVIRGASSLQYGTQFGGLINFKFKQAPKEKPLEIVSKQTIGSFNFLNSFNSLGFNYKNWSGYGFFQHKQGDGSRPNSAFNLNATHFSLHNRFTEKLDITIEYSYQKYLAKQPGGITDRQFIIDPYVSKRNRNWFDVDWHLGALIAEYQVTDRILLNTRFSMLNAGRQSLGYTGPANREDVSANRDLLADRYTNYCNETRAITRYNLLGNISNFLIGTRVYMGNTVRKQGYASNNSDADFRFIHPEHLEGSSYSFPSTNIAVFAENVFQLTPKWSVTPGIRFEYIKTTADGYYRRLETQGTTVFYDTTAYERKSNARNFVIGGVGTAYKLNGLIEGYANYSQNYRAINFNDMRVVSPSMKVDPKLQDERGYTADLGFRGEMKGIFTYDVSIFYLAYNNRIGSVNMDDLSTLVSYRYRTNVASSKTYGIECFAEMELLQLLLPKSKSSFSVFVNLAKTSARYYDPKNAAFNNKVVEYVPAEIYRTGLTYRYKGLTAGVQVSYTGLQYSDATNAKTTDNAVDGIIPAYTIVDASVGYTYKRFSLSASGNNLTDLMYLTRRADGYPGPGILPSDPRTFYLTLGIKL